MIMIHIPRHRRFVCTQCGSQKVAIRSVWPDRKPTGPFYSPSISGRGLAERKSPPVSRLG
jgi:hypothetical protein